MVIRICIRIDYMQVNENMKIKSTVVFCSSFTPLSVWGCAFSQQRSPTGFADVLLRKHEFFEYEPTRGSSAGVSDHVMTSEDYTKFEPVKI